jgi:hypothetical protein
MDRCGVWKGLGNEGLGGEVMVVSGSDLEAGW